MFLKKPSQAFVTPDSKSLVLSVFCCCFFFVILLNVLEFSGQCIFSIFRGEVHIIKDEDKNKR